MTKFYGKYKGEVVSNTDPEQRGRLRVKVPAVYGEEENWALPCVPFAGPGVGFFALPPTGAKVWVEFEGGDRDYPIWAGCFWGLGEAPATPAIEQMKVLKTDLGSITLNDTPGAGGIIVETTTGMKITLSATGLEINNGQGGTITLQGPNVSVNNGALEVT